MFKDKVGVFPHHGACQKGFITNNTSFLLNETIVHNVESGSPVYVTYFDTTKAFDTV